MLTFASLLWEIGLATFTWVGGTSSNWSDQTNWSPAGVPNDITAVAIVNDPASDADIINGTNITVGSLSVGGTGPSAGQVVVGGSAAIGSGGGGTLTAATISLTSTDSNGALVGGPGGVIATPAMTIGTGAVIGGGGTYDVTTLVNNGIIQADGGRSDLLLGPVVVAGGTVSGSGHFEIDHTSTLEINSTTSQNVTVVVDASETATLVLDRPGSFTGALTLINPDSHVNLFFKGQTPTGATFQNGSLIVKGAGGTTIDTIPLTSPNNLAFSVSTSTLAGFGEVSIAPATQSGLPAPDADGIVRTTLSSSDLAQILQGDQSSLRFIPGTEAIALVDGTLSVGPDTNEAFVARLYQGVLGRAYDANGLALWDTALTRLGKAAVARSFLDSVEYQSAHVGQDNSAFVNGLYQSMLDRPAESGGLAGWTQGLAGGMSRGEVAMGLADSPEAKQHWSGMTSGGVFAHDLNAAIVREDYHAAFGREADTSGLTMWTNLRKSGVTPAQLARDLAASTEFQVLHNQQTDLQYVDSLYVNGLGRQAAPSDEAIWLNALRSGASRGDVLAGIAQSPEGQSHLQWALT